MEDIRAIPSNPEVEDASWTTEYLDHKPSEFEKIYDGYYYRRNIQRLENGQYRSERKFIDEKTFQKYMESTSGPAYEQNQSNTQVIMSAQADTFETLVRDMNTLMLAIVDLYETLITK